MSAGARPNNSTILLVDDDDTLGQVLGKLLAREGHSVVRAGSVGQALEVARECRPALGLLDLCLPDGDGVELARRLEAEVGRFPLLLMTAYPVRLRDNPELARQFARVLTKPLDFDELRRAVDAGLTSPVPAPAAQPVATPAVVQGPALLSQPPAQDRDAGPAQAGGLAH
jgi:DNA-binding response OmpR family regulator